MLRVVGVGEREGETRKREWKSGEAGENEEKGEREEEKDEFCFLGRPQPQH